jgi:ubiquinone/menaquinone biosynthesis C-methylase UbiE
MTNANAEQIEYWNGSGGERFARHQQFIDYGLGLITDAALERAAPAQGAVALDIGCGCADTTIRLREMVGEHGAVMGVDVSQPMLRIARARAHSAGLEIRFAEADAATFNFQPVFDLVFSRFGVMFFADPVAAFANIHRALKPEGRLFFVCWRAADENAWSAIPFEAAREFLPPMEKGDPDAPGPYAFADGGRVGRILEQAGFHDVRVEKLDSVMRMGSSLDAAAENALSLGPVARASSGADEKTLTVVRERIRAALAQYETPDGIAAPAACWLASAAR